MLIEFSGDRVKSLSASGRTVDLMRLDPVQIGGIFPQHGEDRVLVQLANRVLNDIFTAENRAALLEKAKTLPNLITGKKIEESPSGEDADDNANAEKVVQPTRGRRVSAPGAPSECGRCLDRLNRLRPVTHRGRRRKLPAHDVPRSLRQTRRNARELELTDRVLAPRVKDNSITV